MDFCVVDIEATDLKADKGFLFCVGFKPIHGKSYVLGLHHTGVCKADVLCPDRLLIKRIYDEMMKYDGWITWNGKKYDIPYLNDRLLLNGMGTLVLQHRFHIDNMWQFAQFKSTFCSKRLDWVAKKLRLSRQKTVLELDIWLRAKVEAEAGLKQTENYDYIVKHCKRDIDIQAQVYEASKPRIKQIQRC